MNTNICVLFDLDNTCIHSIEKDKVSRDWLKDSELDYFEAYEFIVFKRPHVDKFIEWVGKNARVGVWSAGEKDYVHNLASKLFKGVKLDMVLWREHCKQSQDATGNLKDIQWLKSRLPLCRHVIIIDDLAENVHHKQGLRIREFIATDPDAPIDAEFVRIASLLTPIFESARLESPV